MIEFSFDILRQTGHDLWLLICAIASATLVAYSLIGRVWRRSHAWFAVALILIAVCGTGAIVVVPRMQTPIVGLVWTFVVISILSITFYLNLITTLGFGRILLLLALRIFAVALLILMLFEPVVRYSYKPKPERPLLMLIDASGSMSFPDVQNGPSRLQSIWQTLRPQLAKINEQFVPQYFTFSTDLTELKRPEELAKVTANGAVTDIAQALTKLLAKDLRDDSAIILISDGIDNVSANVADVLRAGPIPIHTVRVGSEIGRAHV